MPNPDRAYPTNWEQENKDPNEYTFVSWVFWVSVVLFFLYILWGSLFPSSGITPPNTQNDLSNDYQEWEDVPREY